MYELNWMDAINNPIHGLSDNDEDYVYSKNTSFAFDEKNDCDENVDFDSQFER